MFRKLSLQTCNDLAATAALVLGLPIMLPVPAAWGVEVVIPGADNGDANQDSGPVPGLNAQFGYPPATPTNLTAVTDGNAPGRVWLAWYSPPHPDGADPITHHEYRYRQSGSGRGWGDWTAVPFSAPGQLNANQFTLTGLTKGVSYEFQLRAVSDAGGSPPANVAGAGAGVRSGICDRTRIVQDAIIGKVSDADDCAQVTEPDLPAVTGSLAIRNASVALRPGDFDGLTSLATLDLSGNSLSELPAGIFDDLTSLTGLNLSNNRLSGLPAGIFSRLPALEVLDLRANRLTALPDGIFSGLTNLRALHLEGNAADPVILAVSLELDEQSRLRATVPAGAPFDVVLSLGVANGSLAGGVNTVTVPTGALESALLAVVPTVLSLDTTVEIASLPLLPGRHTGYRLENSAGQALVIPGEGNATGAPVISGTARVGQTLTVDTDGILDADGKAMAESGAAGYTYSYRWVRVDSDGVSNATGIGMDRDSYALEEADAGTKVKVQVSFTDDAGNTEALTSAAYPPNGVVRGGNAADAAATGAINDSDPLATGWLARFGRTSAVQVLGLLDARFEETGAAASQLTLGGRRIRLPGWQSGRWSLWGRGALTRFAGRDAEVRIEGDVLTGVLGLDYRTARRLTGVALSWSDGDGRYRSAADGGALDSHMAGVYPYGRYALTDSLSVWGVLGYGRGEMRLQQAAGEAVTREAVKTGTGMGMGAAGIRGIVYSGEAGELAVKSDALWVRTAADATDGMAGVAAADASRIRLLLAGRHRRTLWNGGVLTPDVELGLRHDGGAAETGFGLELGGGLRYTDPLLGLVLETRARGLLTHEDNSYGEWGLSGSVQLDPGRAGRGLMLRLASGRGVTASGTQALWERQDGMGPGLRPGGDMGSRLSAEWSYGLDLPWRRGVLTPYASVDMDGRGRRLRLGWRYELGRSLSLSLDGERRERPRARPEHGLMLRMSLPWWE